GDAKTSSCRLIPNEMLTKEGGRSESSHDRTEKIVAIIERRLSETEKIVQGNLGTLDLCERLGHDWSIRKQLNIPHAPPEQIERKVIEEVYSIERDLTWPAFREMGVTASQ